MAKTKRFGFALLASIVLLSTIIFASVNDLTWVGFPGDTATIAKGDSVSFDVAVASFEPGASYTLGLYDSNDNLIANLRTGTVDSTGLYSETITLTPADYGNIGGIFYLNILSSEGTGLDFRRDVDELNLIIIQSGPLISDIPDMQMETDQTATLGLDNYVMDFDDPLSDLTWAVSGNANIIVSIDPATHIATFTIAGGWTGAEILNFTVTDPSGDSASDTMTMTVLSDGALAEEEERNPTVRNIQVESVGDGLIKIRNVGMKIEDVQLKIKIEAFNMPLNSYIFDINPNTVTYRELNTGDLESGTYIAKVELSAEDSDDSGFMLVEI